MQINWLEWLGYLASLIVLISLLMSSIIKLRWINLIGSTIFSIYGFLIGALPVGIMNLGIALINVYYLIKIYRTDEEYFKTMPIDKNSQYYHYFLEFYKNEIEKVSEVTKLQKNNYEVSFFILRNTVPAGVFIASTYTEHTLKIELDFVVPEYRDFKVGNYIFKNSKQFFKDKGFTDFVSYTTNEKHMKYLNKVGFKESIDDKGERYFVKSLQE
ncbi:hypothetical protein QA612_13175 [Evansella sp. AB-P1]|uniref:hypothetical protein n=1 Tax=Evansella sp. AB-P1 TaxID=3037653 RepID=UPI00241D404E|nr:hypothetical protein [Evansella sp. AB-P1]MDG5788435.1 hypothetical protein [Evansella sp. AB-P1]